FTSESGMRAVEKLQPWLPHAIDVIICCDDDTAIGVFHQLSQMRLRVPEDVAIAGFDDTVQGQMLDTPLTTVRQPLYNQGTLAAQLCIKQIRKETVAMKNVLQTNVVYRRSCGCDTFGVKHNDVAARKNITSACIGSPASSHRENLHNLMESIIKPSALKWSDKEIERLLSGLMLSFDTHSEDCFLKEVQTLMYQTLGSEYVEHERDLSIISEIIYQIKVYARNSFPDTEYLVFENIYHSVMAMVVQMSATINLKKYINSLDETIALGTIIQFLNSVFDTAGVMLVANDISINLMQLLGIRSFFLCLYTDAKKPLDKSFFFFGSDSKNSDYSIYSKESFDTTALLPQRLRSYLHSKSFIVSPLFFADDIYGFTLIESDPMQSHICEIISWQISGTIKRLRLVDDLKHQTMQLEESLATLRKTQRQLVEAEKMACLTSLVAGVAHEINTPLGASLTYASYLENKTQEFSILFEKGELKKSDFSKFIQEALSASRGIMFSLKQAANLVQSFKNIAVDQTSLVRKSFIIKNYFQEIIQSLPATLGVEKHSITVVDEQLVEISSFPGVFSQILTNLLVNSLIHGFEQKNNGDIVIEITGDTENIHIRYCDNGHGIPDSVLPHIFEPFNTSKRSHAGSGLGLHIVYNLVTQTLHGSIKGENKPEGGAVFTIVIPREH
ncbi:MAG: substrate-binding domain-containing protein, partial [Chitinivibrionales bacterium]|nr:substrate-binding domain-containing protein [Chitinivibrionales bacterium]